MTHIIRNINKEKEILTRSENDKQFIVYRADSIYIVWSDDIEKVRKYFHKHYFKDVIEIHTIEEYNKIINKL